MKKVTVFNGEFREFYHYSSPEGRGKIEDLKPDFTISNESLRVSEVDV